MNTLQVETETELNVTPEPVAPAPEVDGYYNDKAMHRALDEGLVVLAEDDSPEAYDRYKAERLDRKALASGDPAYLKDAERQQERVERWGTHIIDTVKAARAASEAALKAERPPHQDELEDRISAEREEAQAELAYEQYEIANPGFFELTAEIAQQYGKFTHGVAKEIDRYRHNCGDMTLWFCQHPEYIAEVNRAPHLEQVRFVAGLNEHIQSEKRNNEAKQQYQQPAPARPSAAPPPVKTITGKSHQTRPTLEECSYDEYKAQRMREINKRR
jgi:hypothetical protein